MKATTRLKVSMPASSVHPGADRPPTSAQVQAARLVIEANRKLGKPSSFDLLLVASGKRPPRLVGAHDTVDFGKKASVSKRKSTPKKARRIRNPNYRLAVEVSAPGVLEDVVELVDEDEVEVDEDTEGTVSEAVGESGVESGGDGYVALIPVDADLTLVLERRKDRPADGDGALDLAATEPAPEGGLLSISEMFESA